MDLPSCASRSEVQDDPANESAKMMILLVDLSESARMMILFMDFFQKCTDNDPIYELFKKCKDNGSYLWTFPEVQG